MRIGELAERRLTWFQALMTLFVAVMFISLLQSGDLIAASLVALLLAVGTWAFLVLRRQRYRARTEVLEESALFPIPCNLVWDLIEQAEKAPLLHPNVRRGYRVPDTPDGVGRQQAFQMDNGWTIVFELIEHLPGSRAVSHQVSPPVKECRRAIQTVEAAGSGCTYTVATEVDLPAGRWILPTFEKTWRAEVRDHFTRVQAVLADGHRNAADAAPGQDGPAPRST